MNFVFPEHILEKISKRKLKVAQIKETILSPDKMTLSKKGRKIAQKIIGNLKLRVVYKETEKAYIVVTAYLTKPGRYNGN